MIWGITELHASLMNKIHFLAFSNGHETTMSKVCFVKNFIPIALKYLFL